MPGVSSGTRNIVRPLCFAAAGSVRVSRKTYCAMCAPLVNIFCPSIRQPSPSRTARVCAAATSDPEPGSV
jgi:hypothetical protein